MYTIITLLITVVCVFLGLIVLIQNPKGGGLNSSFGNVGQQLLGARRSTDVVEKATWTLAVLALVFTLSLSMFVEKNVVATQAETQRTEAEKKILENNFNPNAVNNTATPAGQQTAPSVGAEQPVQSAPAQEPGK